jgi:hypothetical protein
MDQSQPQRSQQHYAAQNQGYRQPMGGGGGHRW